MSKEKRDADWVGKHEKRWRWSRFRFCWGHWHYDTNWRGDTIDAWWVWDD